MASPFMPSAPKIPTPQVAPPAPTPDDTALKSAKLANLQSIMARSGRQSTILTGGDNKLGG